MIPMKILNRLRLGREVAAEVKPHHPTPGTWSKAWILIIPVLREGVSRVRMGQWSEARITGDHPQPIRGYRAVRVEVHLALDRLWAVEEEDLADEEAIIEEIFVPHEADIERSISHWLEDPALLRHPNSFAELPFVIFRFGLGVAGLVTKID